MRERTDEEHLSFATQSRRVLITHNVGDFRALHRHYVDSQREHFGIILIHQEDRLGPGEVARRMMVLLSQLPEEGLKNRAEFLS